MIPYSMVALSAIVFVTWTLLRMEWERRSLPAIVVDKAERDSVKSEQKMAGNRLLESILPACRRGEGVSEYIRLARIR